MSKTMEIINANGGKEMKFWYNCAGHDKVADWRKGKLAVYYMEKDCKEYNPFTGSDYKLTISYMRDDEGLAQFLYFHRLMSVLEGKSAPFTEEEALFKTETMYTDSFVSMVELGYIVPCKDWDDYTVVEHKGMEMLTSTVPVLHTWYTLEPISY